MKKKILEKRIVLYRNSFYEADYMEDWSYIIYDSKNKPIDITEKKFVEVPKSMDIVEFSLLYHNNKPFRF